MSKNRGQSIIEYCLLAMLIIVGTIVMGPYVIRSVNAHFKLWQESIDDSTNDRMTEVPMNIVAPECNCSGKNYGGCGSTLQRSSLTCSPNQRYWYTPCSPPTCGFGTNFAEGCEDADEFCCNHYIACSTSYPMTSCCGSAPIDPNNPRPTTIPANGFDAVLNDTSDYHKSCYFGEEIFYNQCNSNQYHCKPRTDGKCSAACTGNLPRNTSGDPTAEFCPGADQNLTQDIPLSIIGIPCPDAQSHNDWYRACDYSSPFITTVPLVNFSPQSNYTLFMSPPSHALRLGIRLRVKIKDTSGTEVLLPCHTSPSGQCSNDLFELPNSSNPSWIVNANDLSALSNTGPYTLIYEWVDFMPGDGRRHKFNYGVAISLKSNGTPSNLSFTCPLSGSSPTNIDAGSASNNCNPVTCPIYCTSTNAATCDPQASKCLATCKTGYKPGLGYNNILTCVPDCTLISALSDTKAKTDQDITYKSPLLPSPQTIKVKVFTEDLDFRITFFDASGVPIQREECTRSGGRFPNVLPGKLEGADGRTGTCGGIGKNNKYIESYTTSYTASQVEVYVQERGDNPSKNFGYDIQSCGGDI